MWQTVKVVNPYNPRPRRRYRTQMGTFSRAEGRKISTFGRGYDWFKSTSEGKSIARHKRKRGIFNPYTSRSVPRFTHAARTPRQKRQWLHVYDSARASGASEGSAIAQASGVVGKRRNITFSSSGKAWPSKPIKSGYRGHSSYSRHITGLKGRTQIHEMFGDTATRKSIRRHKKKRGFLNPPRKRNQNAITDALALKIADKVGKYLKPRKRVAGHKRRNIGYWTKEGREHEPSAYRSKSFMYGYMYPRLSKSTKSSMRRHLRKTAKAKRRSIFSNPMRKPFKYKYFKRPAPFRRKKAKTRSIFNRNPALAVIGLNPKRDRYGRFVKRNVRARRSFFTYEGRPHSHSRGAGARKRDIHSQLMSGGYSTAERKSIRRHTKKRSFLNHRRKNVREKKSFFTLEDQTGQGRYRRIKGGTGRRLSDIQYGQFGYSSATKKSVGRHRRKLKKKGIFSNPKRRSTMATRRRRRLPPRNAKGHFIKASRRRRKSNPVKIRRRRNVRTLRKRRRRTNPVRAIRRRRRVNTMAHRRRRRRHTNPVRHHRRRRVASVRRRRRHNPVRHYRNRVRHRRGRRRNALLGGVMQRIDWKSVLFVSGGVFLGDKLSGIVSDKIMSMTTMIPSTAGPWVKLAVGVLAAGLAWKFQPAFGLGIAVGATNSLLNQYVFGPAWGYVAPTLGVSGLADYQNRGFKMDNWIGQSAGSNVAGLGMNPLLQNRL